MRKSLVKRFCLFAAILYLPFMMTSCSSTQKIKYFQDIPDSGQLKNIPAVVYIEPKIQVDDILTITVQTIDPTATQMINSANIPLTGSQSSTSNMSGLTQLASGGLSSLGQTPSAGVLVDKSGDVDIPVLGKVHVVGYSTSELKNIIFTLASKFYKDPTVTVRYANFRINVTGEVLKPGVYVMPNEKVSILDALAMAGDLTVFGKRENVLLIRENPDGTKTPFRINLKKSDIMYSPSFYLRQNDLIYVEPRKAKSDATDAAQQKYVTIAGALLSIILVLAYRVK